MTKHNILLFIPVYNCSNQVERLVTKLSHLDLTVIEEIIFVDNLSSDNTLQSIILATQNINNKVSIFQNKVNVSLGGSLKNAFLYSIANSFDYVAILHGDDQAEPKNLLTVINDLNYYNFDLNIGSRFKPGSKLIGYSPIRNIGNRLMNIMASLITLSRINDLIAGINMFKVDFLKTVPFLEFPNDLTFDAHLLLASIKRKGKINYFNITWTESDQISNAKIFKQGVKILKILINYYNPKSIINKTIIYYNKEIDWVKIK
jgi:glycosyltransferase involved in cell wall biosynthesis